MSEYARKKFGKDSPEARQEYKLGDVNTTLIHTAKGKTIMLQYDVCTPPGLTAACKPYAVLLVLHKNTPCLAAHWSPTETLLLKEKHWKKYYPAINILFSATIGEEAHRRGLPNEMNYVMDYRLIYCLRNGLPLDMDVYDAAEWSCITELSEKSVLNGSIPVEIPDFTRGAWKTR